MGKQRHIAFLLQNDLEKDHKKILAQRLRSLSSDYVISFYMLSDFSDDAIDLLVTDVNSIRSLKVLNESVKVLNLVDNFDSGSSSLRSSDLFLKFDSGTKLADIKEEIMATVLDRSMQGRAQELKDLIFEDEINFSLAITLYNEKGSLEIIPLKNLFVDTFVNRFIIDSFLDKFELIQFSEWTDLKLKSMYDEVLRLNSAVDPYQYENTIFVMKSCVNKILEHIKTTYGKTVQSKIATQGKSAELSLMLKVIGTVEWNFLSSLFTRWGYNNFDTPLKIKDILRLMYQLRVFLKFLNKIIDSSQQEGTQEEI